MSIDGSVLGHGTLVRIDTRSAVSIGRIWEVTELGIEIEERTSTWAEGDRTPIRAFYPWAAIQHVKEHPT